jgi:hypothetical protein
MWPLHKPIYHPKKGKQEKVHNVFTSSKDPICPRFIANFLATKYALERDKKKPYDQLSNLNIVWHKKL